MQRPGEWDVFRWNGLRHAPSAYASRPDRAGFMAREGLPDYIMALPSSWDELKARVSSNMRKNLRKAYDFFERDGFSFVFRSAGEPDAVRSAIERFLALHAARSAVDGMIYHENKFSKPHTLAFLLEYTKSFAERDEVRIFELEVDGKTIASRLAFIIGDDLYMYFTGYDPAWRRYSVMTILMSEIIKWAIGEGLKHVNLSTGNDQSKLRWKPEEIMFHDAVQVSPTARGWLAYRAFLAYEAASRRRTAWAQRAKPSRAAE